MMALVGLTAGRALAAPSTTVALARVPDLVETIGVAQIQLVRSGNTDLDFTVDFATRIDTATPGADYVATNGTLHFLPGQTTQSVNITILDDNLIEEPSEYFVLALTNASNGAIVNSAGWLFEIKDDEGWSFFDGTFDPGRGPDGSVFALALQPNAQVLLGGEFTQFVNGDFSLIDRARIARLNPDGSVDLSFDSGSGPDNTVYAVGTQTNGQVLIGGAFRAVSGSSQAYLARLNADGSLDPGFGPVLNDEVRGIAVQPDGRIVIAGRFTTVNGQGRNRVVRLNSDGSLDPAFDPDEGASDRVRALALQNDGKIIIGGEFISVAGTSRRRIARLNADGSLDLTFDPGTGASAIVRAVATQSDGKVLIGGEFLTVNGTSRPRIARLNGDGGVDPDFNAGSGPDDVVRSIALQPDGKVLIGGRFSTVDGLWRAKLAQLQPNGAVDEDFRHQDTQGNGFNDEVFSIVVQPDGLLLLGGQFVRTNDFSHSHVERVFGQPTAPSFALTSPYAFSREQDGPAAIAVRRLGETSGTVSVDFATRDGTALGGEDFPTTNGTLRFGPGETVKYLVIPIINDFTVESDESFGLELTGTSVGAGVGLPRKLQVYLFDNDVGVNFGNIPFSTTFATNESAGTALISVTRGTDSAGTVTVDFFTADGTALAGVDYLPTSGRLTFAPGVTNQTFALTVLTDAVVEGTETVRLFLTNAVGIGLGKNHSTELYLTDAAGSFGFWPTPSTNVWEDVANGRFEIRVIRSYSGIGTVTVDYNTENGSALAGQDYGAVSGTLIFTNGEFLKSIFIPIMNDDVPETNEFFRVRLANPSAGASILNSTATVGILDEDNVFEFVASTNRVAENAGTASILVRRTGDASVAREVSFATGRRTAVFGQDYAAPFTNSLVFGEGESLASIGVEILDDSIPEFDETVELTLLNPSPPGSRTNTTLVILDDDRAPGDLEPRLGLSLAGTSRVPHIFFNTLQGGRYQLESIANLPTAPLVGTNFGWQTIVNHVGVGGPYAFEHTAATNWPAAFYRLLLAPP